MHNMSFSAKVSLRQPARKDGSCQVRLQVVIRRAMIFKPVGFTWYPELFDEVQGECLSSQPKAQQPATISRC